MKRQMSVVLLSKGLVWEQHPKSIKQCPRELGAGEGGC